jgi:type VI secretion system protein
MAIRLKIISDHHRQLGENSSRVFGVNGGYVGRAPDNDWVLPDPRRVISGHHFEIEYRSGAFWLRDTSTNGVFVNGSDEPAFEQERVELHDGDRLRVGDYEIAVIVDDRIDFLPGQTEEHSASKHLDDDIGHMLDLDSLLAPREVPREAPEGGEQTLGPAVDIGVKVSSEMKRALKQAANPALLEDSAAQRKSVAPPQPRPDATQAVSEDWHLGTRRLDRDLIPEAIDRLGADAKRKPAGGGRARQTATPFHQQAATWADLNSAVQAFCRGAGIDPSLLSPEAQSVLPLMAGQLLREAVVGLSDIAQSRAQTLGVTAQSPAGMSNPLRSSSSVNHALQRLFESHGRLFGGPVDAMRDVLQEIKEHESAMAAAQRAGLLALLEQLSPANVADQFEQGRARTVQPGQDPKARYWDHYTEFYRMLTQQNATEGIPRPFTDEFAREYARARAEQRAKKPSG